MLSNGIYQVLCRRQKLMAQAWALTFVPEKSFIDVRRCSRADKRCASARAIADAVQAFIPRNTDRTLALKVVEPSIKLLCLRVSHRDGLGG